MGNTDNRMSFTEIWKLVDDSIKTSDIATFSRYDKIFLDVPENLTDERLILDITKEFYDSYTHLIHFLLTSSNNEFLKALLKLYMLRNEYIKNISRPKLEYITRIFDFDIYNDYDLPDEGKSIDSFIRERHIDSIRETVNYIYNQQPPFSHRLESFKNPKIDIVDMVSQLYM